ncbi:MAG TPA: DUF4129 domain-containing protein [Acidimicrobiales bacterium]|nr:DUF4129 domain-containing protein [Acidimicrobiales bacterium]
MTAERRAVLVLVLAAVLVAVPAAGQAESITGSQLQALAQRAATDPRALAELRAVREVDGRPVDVDRALAGAEGAELAARLRPLAEGGGGAVVAAEASEEAASILEGRRFREPDVPRPFAGILRTIGRWLEPLLEPLGRGWAWVGDSIPAQLVLVAVVFAAALVVSLRLVGRRGAQAVRRSRSIGVDPGGLDPDDLEREALGAERAGDLDRAVRLRFVAGVLRLDRAGVVTYRSSLTTGQLKARVGSTSFAQLAGAFDEIAYGGRPAEESDVDAAKRVWPRVLAEAGR